MSFLSLLGQQAPFTTATTTTNTTLNQLHFPAHQHNVYGPGSWQQLGMAQAPHPYINLEIINVLECANNDDATEKVGAFRKMIPPEQDLMLFGKWIVVFKSESLVPGMVVQFVIPAAVVNTNP